MLFRSSTSSDPRLNKSTSRAGSHTREPLRARAGATASAGVAIESFVVDGDGVTYVSAEAVRSSLGASGEVSDASRVCLGDGVDW